MMFSPLTMASPSLWRGNGLPRIKLLGPRMKRDFHGRERSRLAGRELLLHALRLPQEFGRDLLREVHGLARLHDHVARRARGPPVQLEGDGVPPRPAPGLQ